MSFAEIGREENPRSPGGIGCRMNEAEKKFLCYKGKPLVRSGNIIYYGSMTDEYVCMLQIIDQAKLDGEEIANNVIVQLMRTGKEIKPQDIIVKKSEKVGLYPALDIASIWLKKALN